MDQSEVLSLQAKTLYDRLQWALETKADDADDFTHAEQMRARYTAAFVVLAHFLKDVEPLCAPTAGDRSLARHFERLAWIFHDTGEGIPHPMLKARALGRDKGRPIPLEIRRIRHRVILAVNLLIESGRYDLQEAAAFVAKKFPMLERLLRDKRETLKNSITGWYENRDSSNDLLSDTEAVELIEGLSLHLATILEAKDQNAIISFAVRQLELAAQDALECIPMFDPNEQSRS